MEIKEVWKAGSIWSGTTLALALGAIIMLAGLMTLGTGTAGAKVKQPGCAKFKKQKRKAKTKSKRRRATSRLRHCKTNRKVYNKVKNGRYRGYREDGQYVDITLCANGVIADNIGAGNEDLHRSGWKISMARVKGKRFAAAFEGSRNIGRVGSIKRTGKGWQVGIEIGGINAHYGDATRTNYKKECRRL